MAQVVLDGEDIRSLAEFWRLLLGYEYREGDDPPGEGQRDESGEDWLVLLAPGGARGLAFQAVDRLPPATWPEPSVPQQMHLDLTVPDVASLELQHGRVLSLGGRLLLDRSDDPHEPLRVYADPAGHPFCVFVSPGS